MRTLVRHRAPSPQPPPAMTQAASQPSAAPDVMARRQKVTARSALRRGTARGGHGLAAWAAGVALGALAAITSATPAPWAGPVAGLAGGVALLAVTCNRTTGWKSPALRAAARVYAAVVALAATGWLSWVAVAGPSRLAFEVLIPAWLICYLPYWNRHRPRHVHGKPEQRETVLAELPHDELIERLRTRVCVTGGPVPGAQVEEMPPINGGRRFLFRLVPGKQTASTVTGARAQIASAAEAPLGLVLTEGMPGEDGERGPEHLAVVTVLDSRHPQKHTQEFDGPTLEQATGLFTVGPYPDGEVAQNRLYKVGDNGEPVRSASGLTCGAQGSGKSRYAEHKALEHLASGLFQVVLLDGQLGTSIPGLTEYAAWPALSPAEWDKALRALLRLMVSRSRRMAAKRMAHWDPAMGPFVQTFIEEANVPLSVASNLLAVKTLVQQAEKNGIGVDISTQYPSQVELGAGEGAGGAAAVLRSLASSGNVTLFRLSGKFARNVTVGEVEVTPHLLPDGGGWCHPLGASMRTANVRAIRASQFGEWAHRFTTPAFSAEDIEALEGRDRAWSTRHDRLEQHLATAGDVDVASLDEQVAILLKETTPAEADRRGKPNCTLIIAELFERTPRMTRADVIESLHIAGYDYSDNSVDKALAALKKQGGLRMVAHGEYERAASGGRS